MTNHEKFEETLKLKDDALHYTFLVRHNVGFYLEARTEDMYKGFCMALNLNYLEE